MWCCILIDAPAAAGSGGEGGEEEEDETENRGGGRAGRAEGSTEGRCNEAPRRHTAMNIHNLIPELN